MWSCFLSRLKEIRANPCGSFERWTSWAHLPGLWKSWAADGRRSCGHWALFEVTVLEGHPVGRAGWRTLQLPLSQVMFSIGLGVRDGCWPHSGGLCLAGVAMQRDNTTVGQGKESFVSRWSLLMFHSLSALGPERSQVTFWEPLRSGAPAEQPRESPYNGNSMSHVPALTLIPGPACMVGSAAWRGGLLPCLSLQCCPSPQRGWSRPRSIRALVTCSLPNIPL